MLNKNKKVGKQDLYEWTSRALQIALTAKNIKSGFKKTEIWSLDHAAAIGAMAPSTGFTEEEGGSGEGVESPIAAPSTPAEAALVLGQGGTYPLGSKGTNLRSGVDACQVCRPPSTYVASACEVQQSAIVPCIGTNHEGACGALPNNAVRGHHATTLLRSRCQGSGPPSNWDGGPASNVKGEAASSVEGGPTSSSKELDAACSLPSHALGAIAPWEPTAQLHPTHFYVDV